MATRRELTEYIRFRLGQLGAQNQHHEFEHVARHIARSRIAINILPSTGPVAGVGDQGRDAETFRTYLLENPLKGSAFVGLVSDKPIAFACTIQEDELLRKIKQDVEKIASAGIRVASAHYFTVANLKSGVRHQLQTWAQSTYDIHLEIHDGQFIAENLADPDLFWVATDFLAVPREMYPEVRTTSRSHWYVELRAAWTTDPDRLPTLAHFEEIKRAIRHATYTPELRVDLPFWLERLRDFMAGDLWDDLQRRAVYEYLVATLHLKGTLEGLEPDLRRYLDADYSSMPIEDLHDAALLVTFCAGSIPVNAVALTLAEVTAWRAAIAESVETRSDHPNSPSELGQLHFMQGFLELVYFEGSQETNACAAVDRWRGLLETVQHAPMFPLETLIDELTRLSRSRHYRGVAENPAFVDLVHRLDEALAGRMGGGAIAEKARRRAIAHHDNDRLLMAVIELRRARNAAYAYETLEIWLECLLYSAELLIGLGLPFASKYYAMAATWISGRSGKREVETYQPEAILIAARADLLLGNWAQALGLLMLSAEGLLHYVSSSDEDAKRSVANQIGDYLQLILSVAKAMNPDFAQGIEAAFLSHSAPAEDESQSEEAPISIPTATLSMDEVADMVAGEMWGVPFGDLSAERRHTWQANGITWSARWKNDPTLNASAEELLAVMQILALYLAQYDAYFAPIRISFEVCLGEGEAPTVEPSPDVPGELRVGLPTTLGGEGHPVKHTALILGLAVQLSNFASLLPQSSFVDMLRDLGSGQQALSDAYIALPYRRLYWEMADGAEPIVPDGFVYEVPEQLADLIGGQTAHADLDWRDTVIAEFDEVEAVARITRRYEKIPASIPRTIERLQANAAFTETVSVLQAQGWKDWHLLLAIKNVALNHWLNNARKDGEPPLHIEATTAHVKAGLESGDWDADHPVPISEFSEDRLREALDLAVISHELASLGLEPSPLVDLPAIRAFIEQRTRYWELDAPHDPAFPLNSFNSAQPSEPHT